MGKKKKERATAQLRTLTLYQNPATIQTDADARIIRGVSLMQGEVEALGHGMMIDSVTLDQVVDLGGGPKGLKSRFTHPGLSSDGLGKFLGRIHELRREGDKVLGDLHLSALAFKSPTDGDLGSYILERAEEDPESFGMSMVLDVERLVWVLADGGEVDAAECDRPANAKYIYPSMRVVNNVACDAVDEPAANRDGMFSSALWRTNRDAERLFGYIDDELARSGADPDRAYQFALEYFKARGVEIGEIEMGKEKKDLQGDAPAIPATNGDAPDGGTATNDGAADAATLTVADLDEMRKELAENRELLAKLAEGQTIKGVGDDSRVTGMQTSLDKVALAAGALIDGVHPAMGVRPLSGVRELYHMLTGDYEFTGMFQPDRVQFANVTSATMAGLVADALNKRVVNMFRTYPKFWESLVTEEDFSTLQAVKYITLGGVGTLPTVAEGAAYTEMTWDDQTETAAWVKKGGYLGLTLEAIDKDDTRRLQQAPRALAQSAWMTLGKTITALYTTPPTMSDTKAWFHADHNNLGSTALSYAAFEATRTAMAAQTELNSAEPLGGLTVPRYLMVPRALEGTALQMLASEGEPGTANNDENPYAAGDFHDARLQAARRRVVVNDFLSDANDWYAQADPNMYPSVGLGYRFGRAPELVSVADKGSGLMFTNDVMPIKVRWFFAVAPTDWRGVYKQAVT